MCVNEWCGARVRVCVCGVCVVCQWCGVVWWCVCVCVCVQDVYTHSGMIQYDLQRYRPDMPCEVFHTERRSANNIKWG